jgi:hypothetical protein
MRDLSDDDIEVEKTSRNSILKLMLDYRWHQTVEINMVAGATEGTRRLRELRQPPFNYAMERNRIIGSRQWQYRILPRETEPTE